MHACMHSSNESIQIPSDFKTRATTPTPTPTNRTQKHLTKHQKHKNKQPAKQGGQISPELREPEQG
jgi:hypothetical protein